MRLLIVLISFMLLLQPSRANSMGDNIPDFKGMMHKLIDNRRTYNLYNDSIFRIHNRSKWVDFFFRRSTKNHEIYHDNEQVLNTLYGYFNQGNDIPAAAYDSLYNACLEYIPSSSSDPFITKKLSSILINHYKHTQEQKYKSARPCIWLCDAYTNIFTMTKDTAMMEKAYNLMKYAADSIQSNEPEYLGVRAYAVANLSVTTWLLYKVQTIDEYRAANQQLRQIVNDSLTYRLRIPQQTINTWKVRATKEDESLVRNIYFADEKSLGKVFGDSVLNALIQKMDKDTTLSCNSQLRLLIMKERTQCITTKEALQHGLACYKAEVRHRRETSFTDLELNNRMRLFTNLAYLNDVANIPEKQKRKNSQFFCREINKVYKKRKDQQGSNNYIKYFVLFTTYPRLINHLTENERIEFLQSMIVNTQVTTYAHSVHVGKLAEALTDGIITYRPELLVGVLGCNSVKEVRKYRKEIKYFMHRGSLFHDLGKNDMVSVVSNDYRPLTDEEREIIKMHPRYGLKYLNIASILAPFRDITLGHHKWYNGGGYPEDFDNIQSNKRILIDIVTLCDCLQAATEKLGRNYKKTKSFEAVMRELRKDAGTRYNPYLIQLIDHNDDVKADMKKVAIDGWLNIYYDIYKRYFK